jgi:NAD(P)-dependent dehydrogenase (short-subunit alcohol dehydrogenase family)
MNNLDGKTALVTGGSRGIGLGAAISLAQAGARVAISARNIDELKQAADEIAAYGPAMSRAADVTSEAEVQALTDAVVERFGGLDILVCSHGAMHPIAPAHEFPLAQFERTLAVNLTGTFLAAKHAARHMINAGVAGRIIAISSQASLLPDAGLSAYNTSKTALNGLVRSLALDFAPYQITVNAVAPGWVRTSLIADDIAALEPGVQVNPLGRIADPADMGAAVAWIASPQSWYLTGAIIPVDGGITAMAPLPWRP